MPAMRFITSTISILLLAAMSGPVLAQDVAKSTKLDTVKEQVPGPLATEDQRLDSLFTRLKKERGTEQALGIANEIREVFTFSGSPTVDLLMQNSSRAINEKRYGAALDFLDQVTLIAPDYAEGWNRRATTPYLLGNYPKAMSDSARVLALEPRHIGALAGIAGILQETGHDRQALAAWEAYLAYYPADREAQQQMIELTNKLAGQKT
jgi:tetratricopeptide (TPR) repeat protein